MRAWLVVSFGVTVAVAHAEPAADPEARRHFDRAGELYRGGNYTDALVELKVAYARDPQPEYLWAIAQAHRYAGDCAAAIEGYGAYLRTGPTPAATKATQALIDDCETVLAAQRPAPAPAPIVAPVGPPKEPLVIREVQRVYTRELYVSWYRDWKGDALVGAGIAGLVTSIAAFAIAGGHDDRATNAIDYATVDREVRARDRAQVFGAVSLVAGGALVVGGLVRYALRPKRVKTEVLVEPVPGGAAVGVSWSIP